MQPNHRREFIIDANALIDYCESDIAVLSLVSTHVGSIHIARGTFHKVNQLTTAAAAKHHMEIVTPDLETILAATATRGALAHDDRETLLITKKYNWTCITNDKALRRECASENVPVLWGLEPMRLLVEYGLTTRSHVIKTARLIQRANPRYITSEILTRFEEQIRAL